MAYSANYLYPAATQKAPIAVRLSLVDKMDIEGGHGTMFKEFKAFIARGNVIELAIGIILGTAFTNIVNSLVEDIIMPPLGLFIGKVDFNHLFINLSGKDYATLAAAQAAGAATINYGLFINTIISFLIVSFAVFVIIKPINRFRSKQEEQSQEIPTKACPYCLSEIPVKATKCAHCTSDIN